ncbi:SNF2 domain-containing protein CLASSY 1-like isoform X2 [Malus sylvestris]|uniref:SNF2 domain-containing protein CLASSY 1-like isoform X2 n=1 Tax=Malus sylvestris TaxID=3752 RepID=UPI0021AC4315|nr:SNF2 domain-containing protein CLASSY 1-like isoform X2 [Malus sylvestris]
MRMKRKRHLYRAKHPFDANPFEALCCGSWQPVEVLSIRRGKMAMSFGNNHPCIIRDKGPFANLRVRSRHANMYDCTCFLRPGVDICVLSTPEHTDDSEEGSRDPVMVDARISSIERVPHESDRCSCQFYVNFYVNQGPLGTERATLNKEAKLVGIDEIFVFQMIDRDAYENQPYRWECSADCPTLPRTKLLLGTFLSDVSWLLVASVMKRVIFDIRSVKNKIVYQILEGDNDRTLLNSDNYLHAVNFKVDNGLLVPMVVEFVPDDATEADPTPEMDESVPSPSTELVGLRRSKRRIIQPERFLACDAPSEIEIGYVRSRPYKVDYSSEDDELYIPLSQLFAKHASHSEENTEAEQKFRPKKLKSSKDDNYWKTEEELACKSDDDDDVEYKIKTKSKKVKSGAGKLKRHRDELALVEYRRDPLTLGHGHRNVNTTPEKGANESDEFPAKYYYHHNRKTKRKNNSDLDDMDFQMKWDGKVSTSRASRVLYRRHHSIRSKRDPNGRTYPRRSLNTGAYKELINSFLKDMDCTNKPDANIMDQWNEFKAAKNSDQRKETEMPENDDEEEEMSETEMLWKEMELALASAYLQDNEGSNAAAANASPPKSDSACRHEFKLNEEIGIICSICGFVSTEIRDVSPPFVQNASVDTYDRKSNVEEPDNKRAEYEEFNFFHTRTTPDDPETLSEENDNVWALIPELRKKLLFHQKKAFEFLWKNVAGSLEPSLMERKAKKTGGCVISHTPGAGKTFLIIAFLTSYLKLFPGKRPLVLAPKTTLYTWYKEFIKWQIPIPVYLIHGRRTYRVFKKKTVNFTGGPKPTDDVMHVLDCLEKIQKWHAQPSVLVMGYTSFLTLMREDSKFVHRKFMAQVLRESPGLVVLDEGHNPRSTKSRLRKGLMKVETDLRILLSGTLFQNNFCEYFNTLCLARPKFVNEVLRALDPKYRRIKKGKEKARHLMEARARKLFLDKIAKKIDSNEEEDQRIQGLNQLRHITNGFIDVYEGGNSDTLPGLQIYTLLMNTTDIQRDMLDRLQNIMANYKGYPLELELLITLGSIHPWLITTACCAGKFFRPEELMELEQYKYDLHKGSKVKFVLNLVYQVVRNEKVLIFCHNIAPVRLFLELFERVFGWQRGREVLVLTGDLELFDRGKVMDKFEEPGGASRVLLASITACAEGISLTAASRVILLDSEWNPSKTKQAIARAFRPGQQKVVYVYQLLATGTLEEDKYGRTTWKEWVSSMIFSEAFVEDPSRWQAEKIEDDVLREMVAEDKSKSFHMIMKNEKASTVVRGKD